MFDNMYFTEHTHTHIHTLWLDCGGPFLTRPADRRPWSKINPEPPDASTVSVFLQKASSILFPFPDIKFGFVFCLRVSVLSVLYLLTTMLRIFNN